MQSIIALSSCSTVYGKTHFPEGYGLYSLLKNYRARLYMLRKTSCFVSWHDFTCCRKNSLSVQDFTGRRKTHVLYQGPTLVGP